jgi:hypothetical protein
VDGWAPERAIAVAAASRSARPRPASEARALVCIRVATTAPSSAMLSTLPTWRAVLATLEARPARAGSTAASAAAESGESARPKPVPAISPPARWRSLV